MVAGNLGATHLHHAAHKLESALISGDVSVLAGLIESADDELKRVICSIGMLERDSAGEASTVSVNVQDIIPRLLRLRQMVLESDCEAEDLLEIIRDDITDVNLSDALSNLSSKVVRYEFDTAAKAIDVLIEGLVAANKGDV